ncbi:YbjN domain-containing protein [Nocardioides hankookensis]|uniref:YbjN domain-containing protein n=1 Tax=Nocardioides hankookensis TaxID=443157 RepID=A0ABW1LIV1_9ACTN
MTKLFDQIIELLGQSEYDYQVADEEEVLRLALEAPEGSWTAYVRVMANGICVVYSKPEFDAAPEHRAATSEFMTRVNFGILIGNFEMDWSDGEVRFKTAFDADAGLVPAALVVNTIDGNIANMHQYLPALQGVATGEMTVDEALEACGRSEPPADD